MLRVKRIAAGVAAVACGVAVLGSVVAPVASADYMVPIANACNKEIDTSNRDGVKAVQDAELLYNGKTLQVRRLSDKRRWEVYMLSGHQVIRTWADYAGRLTDTPLVVRAATKDDVKALEDSTVTVRRAIMRYAPEDSLLRDVRFTRDDDHSVILLQFDDSFGTPMSVVLVDAETGDILDVED